MTRIVLAALDEPLVQAWKDAFTGVAGVEIHAGSILEVACDAIVSPANSFGFMDGGIDALYVDRFGDIVQDRVRHAILRRHHGELLVGTADIVETDNGLQPFLITAPTMRVPMRLPVDTVNPYLAMRGVLNLVHHGQWADGTRSGTPIRDSVSSVAFPGLGTGVGRVPPGICARQMRRALLDDRRAPRLPTSWAEASEEHQFLYADVPVRLQY